MPEDSIRAAREELVRIHFESETAKEFDTTLSTFDHPHYEVIATQSVYDGREEVMGYYTMTRTAFPDQRHENVRLHHTDDAVIAEFDLLGTHQGELMGIPPTGKSFRCPVIAIFFFEGGVIANERIYFDTMTIMSQLGVMASPISQ